MIFMLALSVQELLNIANGYGNHDGILGIVKTIRPYIEKMNLFSPEVLGYDFCLLNVSLIYLYIYLLIISLELDRYLFAIYGLFYVIFHLQY